MMNNLEKIKILKLILEIAESIKYRGLMFNERYLHHFFTNQFQAMGSFQNLNDENATIGTDTIGIDSDNDSFPTPADNTTLGVKVNDTYPDIKISQKFLSPKELRKAILQVIPERVTVKRLKVTKKEVTISGVLPEHAEMDILLEKLKSISALKRFDTPSLKPNDGGGVTFSLRISLNPEEYVVLPWSYTADIHSENWTCYDCDGGPFAEPHGQPPQEWPDEPRVESGPFRQQN